jgi:chromosome segregation ATPase
MRPTEFTAEEIIKAGQNLLAAGRNVTGFALRQKIGGGSAPRLRQVWDEHLSNQSVATLAKVAELPIEVAEQLIMVTTALTERLTLLATDLNDKAVKAAERRVDEVVRAADVQRAAAERELADASQTVDDLESKHDSLKMDKDLLNSKLEEANALVQKQAVEIAHLTERLASVETVHKVCAGQLLEAQLEKTAEQKIAGMARENAACSAGQVQALERQVSELIAKFGSEGRAI